MSYENLEERLASIEPAPAGDMPDGVRHATRSARFQSIASATLLTSLVIGTAVLAIVAMQPSTPGGVSESGRSEIIRHNGPEPLSLAALRVVDPFAQGEFPGERDAGGVAVRPLRLLPLTDERVDRLVAGDL